MNAISYALADIYRDINETILNIAFRENAQIVNQRISLDERIMSQVIRPQVLLDTDLVGSQAIFLSLHDCNVKQLDAVTYVIEVPKTLTAQRSIISVETLLCDTTISNAGITSMLGVNTNIANVSPVVSQGLTMMNNLSLATVVQTSRLEVIGENTILVMDPAISFMDGVLRCRIANADNLANLNPTAYIKFSTLCRHAVKAFIYTKLKLQLDKGYIYGGHELGVINEIVDTYADSRANYEEFLTTVWKKVMYLNNPVNKERLITMALGNTF